MNDINGVCEKKRGNSEKREKQIRLNLVCGSRLTIQQFNKLYQQQSSIFEQGIASLCTDRDKDAPKTSEGEYLQFEKNEAETAPLARCL